MTTSPASSLGWMTSTEPPKEPDRHYTVLLVPEGGKGQIWQRSVSLKRVRRWIAGGGAGISLLLLGAVLQVATASRVFDHDELVGENLALRSRLDAMEGQLAELEPMIDRVKGYDEQLRDLANKQVLPGFGALSEAEWQERKAWLDGMVPDFSPNEPVGAGIDVHSAATEARLAELAVLVRSIDLTAIDSNLARLETVADVLPQVWPVEGTLTSPFGYRISPYGRRQWRFHGGIDLAAPWGTPIYSTNDGFVTFGGWDSGHGLMVEVDHGNGVLSRYCHASRLYVTDGDTVLAGDTIALVGSTGISTGPHLHYELVMDGERVDPLGYLP